MKGKGVLEGNVFISDNPVRVLFDTGTSHSFISVKTTEKLNLKSKLAKDPLCVKNPIGGSTNLCLQCKNVPISHSLHHFPLNLYILDFEGFNVLLGMNWLGACEADVDYSKRIVSVKTKFGNLSKYHV